MSEVKGTALSTRLKYVEEKAAPEIKEKVYAELTEGFQQEIRKGIFANTWYPIGYYLEINQAIAKIMGNGNEEIAFDVGCYSADQVLHGVYKLFYKIGTPEFVLKNASRVMNQYFTEGKLRVVFDLPRQARIYFEDVRDYRHTQCLSLIGWAYRNIQLSGGKNVTHQVVQCRKRGDPACQGLLKWE